MTSKVEQIMQAIVVLMTVPPMTSVAAGDVHRDVERAIDKSVTTALAIEEGDEPEPNRAFIGLAMRKVDVRITAIAKGAGAMTAADAPSVEAHNRLFADLSLGGLVADIQEADTVRQREALEKPVAAITRTYRIEYRTSNNSLET